MGERREYPAFIVNNGPKAANFNFQFELGMKIDDTFSAGEDNFVSPHEAGKELTERVLTAEPLTGNVAPYSQLPIKFICRTKKFEKTSGFSDFAKKKTDNRLGSGNDGPDAKEYEIPP